VMVPEHLPSVPYTHVTSGWDGMVWKLGSVFFVSQSSACGGWLDVSYCSVIVLSLVLAGGGLTERPVCAIIVQSCP